MIEQASHRDDPCDGRYALDRFHADDPAWADAKAPCGVRPTPSTNQNPAAGCHATGLPLRRSVVTNHEERLASAKL